MPKLLCGLTTGLGSAKHGRRRLQRSLKREWRALRVAQQDRAHLATIAHAPSIDTRRARPAEAAAGVAPAMKPPSRH